MLLFGHDAAVLEWLATRWGDPGRSDAAIGILDRKGTLRGALVLSVENPWTAGLGVYSEGVITPRDMKEFFSVVFGKSGLHRLAMRTERGNKKMKKLAGKIGWTFEGVAHAYYGPHGDALVYYMTPQTCRWIKRNEQT